MKLFNIFRKNQESETNIVDKIPMPPVEPPAPSIRPEIQALFDKAEREGWTLTTTNVNNCCLTIMAKAVGFFPYFSAFGVAINAADYVNFNSAELRAAYNLFSKKQEADTAAKQKRAFESLQALLNS